MPIRLLTPFTFVLLSIAGFACGSEFPPEVTPADVTRLLKITEHVRRLSETELLQLVPQQSGFRYVDCPNCSGGRQENQLTWTPGNPAQVTCAYCDHCFPSDKYPMHESQVVLNPRGERVSFPYWSDAAGHRHFFLARRDYEAREYMANRARDLALLYAATGEESHARRAALILDRFAELFPGWCYHYDYPFRQKEIYSGQVSPHDFLPAFRTARWSCWAYGDIPLALVQAYDWIRDSSSLQALGGERELNVAARIENDLLRNAAEQVLANPDPLSNMSPVAWNALVITGRVLKEPRYVHEVVDRCERQLSTKFMYDGSWYEGAPSYALATLRHIEQVLQNLDGYSDPVGYLNPTQGKRFDDFRPLQELPSLASALASLRRLAFPSGRLVPIHDTWASDVRASPTHETAAYLLPALGHACLGSGTGVEQMQFHMTWSGGYGHSHADNLSLLLYAGQRELLSDLGYTHTAYRSWTLATAAHNTVVIDGQNQSFGSLQSPSDGRLLLYDVNDPRVQVVRADGKRAYPDIAETYQRTLVVVNPARSIPYAVDLFEVAGGTTHDYFLHGDADDAFSLESLLTLTPLSSLLPAETAWLVTRNEGEAQRVSQPHYAYGFLRNLQTTWLESNQPISLNWVRASDGRHYLRTWLIPQSRSQLVVGENPSIRQAREDDAQLENFQRPFAMVRHTAGTVPSRFVSLLEPYRDDPIITAVKKIEVASNATVLQIQRGAQTDWIVFDALEPVTFSTGLQLARFQGPVGVLTLQAEQVLQAYSLGQGGWQLGEHQLNSSRTLSATLLAIDEQELVLEISESDAPVPGSVVRIITKDGFTYPFTVSQSARDGSLLRVQVVEGLAMHYDQDRQHLRLIAFPQREHLGSLTCEWELP